MTTTCKNLEGKGFREERGPHPEGEEVEKEGRTRGNKVRDESGKETKHSILKKIDYKYNPRRLDLAGLLI